MNKPHGPPNGGQGHIATTETIPFQVVITGDMTLPVGTPHDAVKAAIMAQLSMSVSLGSLVKTFEVNTTGISIAKG